MARKKNAGASGPLGPIAAQVAARAEDRSRPRGDAFTPRPKVSQAEFLRKAAADPKLGNFLKSIAAVVREAGPAGSQAAANKRDEIAFALRMAATKNTREAIIPTTESISKLSPKNKNTERRNKARRAQKREMLASIDRMRQPGGPAGAQGPRGK